MAEITPTPKNLDRGIADTNQVEEGVIRRVLDDIISSIGRIRKRLHTKTPLVRIVSTDTINVTKSEITESDEKIHEYSAEWIPPFVEEDAEEPEEIEDTDGIRDGIRFYNSSGLTIPAFAALEVTAFQYDGTAEVVRPTADNLDASLVIFNGENLVDIQKNGFGFSPFDGVYQVSFSGSPSIGSDMGTETDSFDLKTDNTEMTYIGSKDETHAFVRPKAGATDTDVYNGPFTVVKKDDSTVTIEAHDGTTYLGRNRITVGIGSNPIISSDVDVTITTSGPVYLKLDYSGSTPGATFHNASALPVQAAGEFYKTIAEVAFSGGAINKITQITRDEIHVMGRIV